MKIEKLKSEKLRNEEHFQYQTEFKDLVTRFTAQTLGVEKEYTVYQAIFANELEALDVVQKSVLTPNIADADKQRGFTHRGLYDTVNGACHHFDSAKKEAGLRLKVVFDHFGNIGEKPYEEQSAATNALVNDLETDFANDVVTLELEGWIAALKSDNSKFEVLSGERHSIDADKTSLKMKEVRKEIDKAYANITNLIDALVLVNGAETYSPFIKELNERVDKYNNILGRRKGRNKKDEK